MRLRSQLDMNRPAVSAPHRTDDLTVRAAQLRISPVCDISDKPGDGQVATTPVPKNSTLRSILDVLKADPQNVAKQLRFQAAATDGGVDTSFAQMVYWADHMFIGNCLQPYCSTIGRGISILGAFQAVPPKIDAEQDIYVNLLKQLLKTSLKHIQQLQQLAEDDYEGPFFPDSLPLSALEQLFVMTWDSCSSTPELSMKAVVKEVAEISGGSAADIHKRAKQMVEDIGAKYSAAEASEEHCENNASATFAPPTPHYSPTYQVFTHPSNPHIVMDSYIMPGLLMRPDDSAPQRVAVIAGIEVNRKGGLSCPVRTGAVLACCHASAPSIMHGSAPEATPYSKRSYLPVVDGFKAEACISETSKEACAQALDELETPSLSALRSCDSFQELQRLGTGGGVPAIKSVVVHRSHSFFQGVTVEFAVAQAGFSKFFSSEEDKVLQHWEALVLGATDTTSAAAQSQKLPGALRWVTEHYSPQQPAAAVKGERGRSGSGVRGASGLRSPGVAEMAASPLQAVQRTAADGSDDDAMNASDDESLSAWGSESDGLVAEEEMAGVEDLWMEHLQLKVELQEPCAANLVSVVLADQEVIEDLRGDEDDGEEPNIDISFVKFKGSMVSLAPGSVAWEEVFSRA